MLWCRRAAGLRQILTDVIDEVRQSVSEDIDGAEILHSLLNAAWLQSLLKVRKHFSVFHGSLLLLIKFH